MITLESINGFVSIYRKNPCAEMPAYWMRNKQAYRALVFEAKKRVWLRKRVFVSGRRRQ
jgi:hypothetical protein